MGFEYFKNKSINRALRLAGKVRTTAGHYTLDLEKIKKNYDMIVSEKKEIEKIKNFIF